MNYILVLIIGYSIGLHFGRIDRIERSISQRINDKIQPLFKKNKSIIIMPKTDLDDAREEKEAEHDEEGTPIEELT